MALLSLYPQFETNLTSNSKIIKLLAKAHGKNYIKVKPHLVRHLLVMVYFHSQDKENPFTSDAEDVDAVCPDHFINIK